MAEQIKDAAAQNNIELDDTYDWTDVKVQKIKKQNSEVFQKSSREMKKNSIQIMRSSIEQS